MADDYSINTKVTGDTSSFHNSMASAISDLGNFDKTYNKASGNSEKNAKTIADGFSEWGLSLNKIYETGSGVFKKFGIDIDKFASKLGTTGPVVAGITAIGVAVVTIGSKIASAVSQWSEAFGTFESKLTEVSTLLPNQTQSMFDQMGDQVKQFDKQFGVLSNESIPALYQAISAGVPENNVFSFMETAEKAAIGGVATTESSVDLLTSVVNAYGEDISQAANVSDALFTAVKDGKTTFDELSRSVYNVVPTAAALGVSFDDVAASLAAITAQGTPTSVATTQMRTMFTELSKSSYAVAQTFQQIAGKSFKDFIAGGGDVQSALKLLNDYANKTGVGINELFSTVEAGNAALELTGSGAEKFSATLADMANKAGATDAAFEKMNNNAAMLDKKLAAAKENLSISLGSMFEPLVSGLIKSETSIVSILQDIVNTISPILSPILGIIGSIISEILKLFANLSSTIFTFIQNWGEIWNTAGTILDTAWKGISKALDDIVTAISLMVSLIFDLLSGNWAKAWDEAQLVVLKAVDEILTAVSTLVNGVIDFLDGLIKNINKISSIIGKSIDIIPHVDLSELTGLSKKIDEVQGKLDKLSNTKVSPTVESTTTKGRTETKSSTARTDAQEKASLDYAKKASDTRISLMEQEEAEAVKLAMKKGKSAAEVNDIIKGYDEKEFEEYKAQLDKEEAYDLEKAKKAKATDADIANIKESYQNKETLYEEKQNEEREKNVKDYSDKIKKHAKDLYKHITRIVKDISSNIASSLKTVAKQFTSVLSALYTLTTIDPNDLLDELEEALDNIVEFLTETLEDLPDYILDGLELLEQFANELVEELPDLMPDIISAIQDSIDLIINSLPSILSELSVVGDDILEILGDVVTTVIDELPDLLAIFTNWITNGGFQDILDALLSLQEEIQDALTDNSDEIFSELESALATAIPELITFLISSINSATETFADILPDLIDMVVSILESVADSIEDNMDSIISTIDDVLPEITSAIAKALPKILVVIIEIIADIISAIIDNLSDIIDTIIEVIDTLFEDTDISTVVRAIIDAIIEIANAIIENLPEIIIAIIEAIYDLFIEDVQNGNFFQVGVQIIEGLIEGLWDGLENLWSSVVSGFNAFIKAFKNFFGIHSPSTVFASFGKNIIQGLINGIVSFGKYIWSKISSVFTTLLDDITSIFSDIGSWFSDTFGSIWDDMSSACSSMASNIVDFFSGLWDDITDIFSGIGSWFSDVFGTIWTDISGVCSTLSTNVLGFFSTLWDGITDIFSGLGEWFESLFSNIGDWFSDVWDDITDAISSLGSSLGTTASSIWSSITSTASSIGSAISSAASTAWSWVTSWFADGTDDAPGGLAVVGEEGPELVNLPKGSSVATASETAAAMAGGSSTTKNTTINATFNSPTTLNSYQMLRKLKQYQRSLAASSTI